MSNAERQRQFRARNPGYRNRFRGTKLTNGDLLRMEREALEGMQARQAACDDIGRPLLPTFEPTPAEELLALAGV